MSYTRSTARGVAVSAAGLADPRGARARSRAEAVRRGVEVVSRLGYVQLDSVNVLARAQDMVLFSRLGPLPPDLLTTPPPTGPPLLVEQWAHEAAVVTPEVARLIAAFPREGLWGSRAAHMSEPGWEEALEQVMARLAESPSTALGVADEFAQGDPHLRHVLETCALHAFHSRRLVGVGRNSGFQRLLADPTTLWQDWSEVPVPPPAEAVLELTRTAVRGLGIARTTTVADWFRTPRRLTVGALERLEELGEVRRTRVEGTREQPGNPWWVPTGTGPGGCADEDRSRPRAEEDGGSPAGEGGARADEGGGTPLPRRRDRVRLLSPFDHLVAHRPRLEELFGVRYRIGIYTPAPKREFGYYDLLVLIGDDIVGRIDLRAERAAGELLVRGFWLEPERSGAPVRTARAVLPELRRVASWQGLGTVRVEEGAPGQGARALVRALGSRG